MTREEFKEIVRELLPKVEAEPVSFPYRVFLPSRTLDAFDVFDCLRVHVDPPVSEDDFNTIANEIDEDRD